LLKQQVLSRCPQQARNDKPTIVVLSVLTGLPVCLLIMRTSLSGHKRWSIALTIALVLLILNCLRL
jgi:hypothetical protein